MSVVRVGFCHRSFTRSLIGVTVFTSLVAVHGLSAQSNLSTQGFGFAQGQLSSRAQSAGGSVGEIDPWSPINPSTLSAFSTRVLFFQAEPEYRTFQTGSATDRTTTSRYPVVFGAIPVGERWVMSLGASTLLDRTATTIASGSQVVGPDTITTHTENRVTGAMDDIRLATAFTPTSWLRLGAGVHAITGRSLVLVAQTYSDTISFQPFTSSRTLTFSGSALSGGAEIVGKQFIIAASGRYGGSLRVASLDTVLGSGRVPDRFGASIAYTGIAGSVIAARTSRDDWSSMNKLGSSERAVDAWDSSIGVDMSGPRLISRSVSIRAGARFRTLPFEAAKQEVKETSYSGGFGTSFAAGHILMDVGLIRAMRNVPSSVNASEHAWTLSVGLTVRQ